MNNSVEIALNMAILPQAPIAVLSCKSSKEKAVSMFGEGPTFTGAVINFEEN